jgi:hypothetical protein
MMRWIRLLLVVAANLALAGAAIAAHEVENEQLEEVLQEQQPHQQSFLRGDRELTHAGSTDSSYSRGRRCPLVKCAAPCPDGKCGRDEKCLTKTSYFSPRYGVTCPGCAVFRKCARKATPRPAPAPTYVTEVCPLTPCQLPCGLCKTGEECKTKPSFFTTPSGKKCPGCPVFVGCVPPPLQQCGKTTCPSGMVCCNSSCGICTPPDGACIQLACVEDDYDEGPQCGRTTCPVGQVCCNSSCDICTKPGGVCTQQICERPPY